MIERRDRENPALLRRDYSQWLLRTGVAAKQTARRNHPAAAGVEGPGGQLRGRPSARAASWPDDARPFTGSQVNNLREIQALRRLSPHPGVIKLAEVLYDQPTGRLALVFELMEMNIYELIRGRRHYLPEAKIKGYMYQLLKSMDHMHRNGIFHRDIKVCGAARGSGGGPFA